MFHFTRVCLKGSHHSGILRSFHVFYAWRNQSFLQVCYLVYADDWKTGDLYTVKKIYDQHHCRILKRPNSCIQQKIVQSKSLWQHTSEICRVWWHHCCNHSTWLVRIRRAMASKRWLSWSSLGSTRARQCSPWFFIISWAWLWTAPNFARISSNSTRSPCRAISKQVNAGNELYFMTIQMDNPTQEPVHMSGWFSEEIAHPSINMLEAPGTGIQ